MHYMLISAYVKRPRQKVTIGQRSVRLSVVSPRNVAVLSDIHIGNNTPTNWYQANVHEKRLVDALRWVADPASDIDELIVLGDLVDTWTYPPDVEPPTMAQIIAANPNTLGRGGALAAAADALGGVTFLLGNHDGQLTQEDLAALNTAVGGKLNFVPSGIYTLRGSTGASTTSPTATSGRCSTRPTRRRRGTRCRSGTSSRARSPTCCRRP